MLKELEERGCIKKDDLIIKESMSMFKVKFKLEKESFVEASLFAYRHHLKGSPKRFLGLIFIAMSQFGL